MTHHLHDGWSWEMHGKRTTGFAAGVVKGSKADCISSTLPSSSTSRSESYPVMLKNIQITQIHPFKAGLVDTGGELNAVAAPKLSSSISAIQAAVVHLLPKCIWRALMIKKVM